MPILTVLEAAAQLGTSPRRVQRLIEDDKLPAFWLDGQWRINSANIAGRDLRSTWEKKRAALPAPPRKKCPNMARHDKPEVATVDIKDSKFKPHWWQ